MANWQLTQSPKVTYRIEAIHFFPYIFSLPNETTDVCYFFYFITQRSNQRVDRNRDQPTTQLIQTLGRDLLANQDFHQNSEATRYQPANGLKTEPKPPHPQINNCLSMNHANPLC